MTFKNSMLSLFFLFFCVSLFSQSVSKVLSYNVYLNCEDTFTNKNDSILKSCKECQTWKYPSRKIFKKILNDMKEITTSEHHWFYNDYKCEINGELIYKRKKYKYYLNAGGYMMLVSTKNNEDNIYLTSKTKRFNEYFLSNKHVKNGY